MMRLAWLTFSVSQITPIQVLKEVITFQLKSQSELCSVEPPSLLSEPDDEDELPEVFGNTGNPYFSRELETLSNSASHSQSTGFENVTRMYNLVQICSFKTLHFQIKNKNRTNK
jgi:hypothetical protein